MQHFDIRITGEVEDARSLAEAVVAMVALRGARINHASLDGREVRVTISHAEIKSDDPDGVIMSISDAAGGESDEIGEQKGE